MTHTIIGSTLILFGLVIRVIAIMQNPEFKTEISKPAVIKTDGIYSIVRHPAYVGSILWFVGLCIVEVHCAVIYLACIFFLSRAQDEEKLMASKEYSEYAKRVGMFMPKFGVK